MNFKNLLFVLFIAVVFISGCTQQQAAGNENQETGKADSQPDKPVQGGTTTGTTAAKEKKPLAKELPITERGFLIGMAGFIPKNHPQSSEADWKDLFDRLPESGELFGVYSGWNDTLVENIPQQVHTAFGLAEQKKIIPIVAIGFEPDSLSQEEADNYVKNNGEGFKSTAVAIAEKFRPKYLALGVEINRYYEKSPAGFADFVALYRETFDAIKNASPGTKVFTVFQVEYMKGGGKLSDAEHTKHWEIIREFEDKLDLVGFTVYPFLDYATPGEIPDGYLAEIKQFTDKPVIITETGWPSEEIAGIPATEESQKEYLIRLLGLTQELELEAIVWILPHDTSVAAGNGLFNHLSLRKNNGQEKQAFGYWQALLEIKKQ
ncbi:MAG: hypothetical protein Q7K34_03175 [archaeon]|nr:hypothetical protein [archaeon]